ncbi:phosphatidate cytidylyltransferase [Gleimia sp. 6138-11-ORH1]|uniref:phosphatidate cytidylyltransferase n=1 Tax=Gleimia sp. 6138-11-ORH1 TaxID=2973937 RepID=UPI0021683E5D|nr:phosphatidate cytidylyltransferase [Gleimia sp. 6138-11-ORH1]MCS4484138.1 phosphatidate cytidylyltransferase [Gleimia sp. 6138-11-ORH1]
MDLQSIYRPGPTENYVPLPASGKAGRNLPAAISVGMILSVVTFGALWLSQIAFLGLMCVLAIVALWELAGAFARKGYEVILPPAWVGSIGMIICAWTLGLEAVLVALCLAIMAAAIWRIIDGTGDGAMMDIMVTTFSLVYVALLASFVVFILASPHAVPAVILFIALAVANDLGGWAAGITFGKHPMAPKISPKKSWEGFAGSLLASIAVGIAGMTYLGATWWWGIILAILTTIAATTGDLVESLIKRDVGLKDMSNLLPGHGGIMDRMDSLLMVAPVLYLVLRVALPW